MGMGFFQQKKKNKKCQAPIKLAQPFRPQKCGRTNYGHEASSDTFHCENLFPMLCFGGIFCGLFVFVLSGYCLAGMIRFVFVWVVPGEVGPGRPHCT